MNSVLPGFVYENERLIRTDGDAICETKSAEKNVAFLADRVVCQKTPGRLMFENVCFVVRKRKSTGRICEIDGAVFRDVQVVCDTKSNPVCLCAQDGYFACPPNRQQSLD